MTNIISRPPIDTDRFTTQSDLKDLEDIVNNIEEHLFDPKLKSIGWLAYKVYRGVQIAIVEGKYSQEKIWQYLKIAKDLFAVNFATVAYKGTKPYVYVDGKEYRIDTSVKHTGEEEFDTFYDPYWWLLTFSLCEILGDIENRNYLITNVTKHMMNKSPKKHLFLETEFAFINAIKGLYLEIPEEDRFQRIVKASKISQKEITYYDNKNRDYGEYIVFGWYSLLEESVKPKNQTRFTEVLTEVINDHKQYYTDHYNNVVPEGWTNFIIMFLIKENIFQHNYDLEVDSEYIPIWILNKAIDTMNSK